MVYKEPTGRCKKSQFVRLLSVAAFRKTDASQRNKLKIINEPFGMIGSLGCLDLRGQALGERNNVDSDKASPERVGIMDIYAESEPSSRLLVHFRMDLRWRRKFRLQVLSLEFILSSKRLFRE